MYEPFVLRIAVWPEVVHEDYDTLKACEQRIIDLVVEDRVFEWIDIVQGSDTVFRYVRSSQQDQQDQNFGWNLFSGLFRMILDSDRFLFDTDTDVNVGNDMLNCCWYLPMVSHKQYVDTEYVTDHDAWNRFAAQQIANDIQQRQSPKGSPRVVESNDSVVTSSGEPHTIVESRSAVEHVVVVSPTIQPVQQHNMVINKPQQQQYQHQQQYQPTTTYPLEFHSRTGSTAAHYKQHYPRTRQQQQQQILQNHIVEPVRRQQQNNYQNFNYATRRAQRKKIRQHRLEMEAQVQKPIVGHVQQQQQYSVLQRQNSVSQSSQSNYQQHQQQQYQYKRQKDIVVYM